MLAVKANFLFCGYRLVVYFWKAVVFNNKILLERMRTRFRSGNLNSSRRTPTPWLVDVRSCDLEVELQPRGEDGRLRAPGPRCIAPPISGTGLASRAGSRGTRGCRGVQTRGAKRAVPEPRSPFHTKVPRGRERALGSQGNRVS